MTGSRSGRPFLDLSRRERQIMEVIYRSGRATAAEVHAGLPDAPSATAVRTMLRKLESKGHLRHAVDGVRHVYMPTVSASTARQSALRNLLRTFFDNSPKDVVAALLDLTERELSDEERRDIARLVQESRRRDG